MFFKMLNTFKWLLWRDIRVVSKDYLNNLLDATLLPSVLVVIFGYIFPTMGMIVNYGNIMLIGTVAGMSMWSASSSSGSFITDLNSQKSINYELTLPIYSYLVYIKYALSYAIKSMLMSIAIIPIGILILGSKIDYSQISLFKLIFAYVSSCLFFGFFTLLVAIMVKDITSFSRFWMRWGWLLFNLGGSQFTWYSMYRSLPKFAIINLLNPLVYPIESLRCAFLGPKDYLPYYFTISMVWFFIILFALIGIKKFKSRLDCL